MPRALKGWCARNAHAITKRCFPTSKKTEDFTSPYHLSQRTESQVTAFLTGFTIRVSWVSCTPSCTIRSLLTCCYKFRSSKVLLSSDEDQFITLLLENLRIQFRFRR